jgi:hypothetical protein
MTAPEAPPVETLFRIAGGYLLVRSLHAVANLGVADALGEEPAPVSALAKATAIDADALGRVLRLLAADGVFEVSGDTVRHTPASRLLRQDHPQSMRALVRMLGLPLNWQVAEHLEESLRTGQPAVGRVLPEGFWAHFAKNEEDARIFDAAMTAKARGQIAGVLAAYDFRRFGRIADIGGGAGHLLRAVLEAAPKAQGILFDLPHVIEKAGAPASPRLTLEAGDFFKDALPAADGYLIMEVIHDWPDAESVAILSAIRRAAPRDAKLLVIEQIVPDTPGPDWSKALDVLMLINLGGRQRTIGEYRALLDKSGFRLEREILVPGISILEATPSS